MNDAEEEEDGGWGTTPTELLYLDTPGYTPKQRFMFVCGYEFCKVGAMLRNDSGASSTIIHGENTSRVRMLAAANKRSIVLNRCGDDNEWWELLIHDKDGNP